ncbi:unnamed protein product [Cyprideis torosa]|uniref:Uncharacterized protein n=1 Tax=Cyprideis torosa TaxID=163714 RepID=A0A7R8ZYV4_9CRUS|nr:unnamed protein product [Cyprideis torosa]CAG0908901.1 unnamed protein product [Cyprideis torosa]
MIPEDLPYEQPRPPQEQHHGAAYYYHQLMTQQQQQHHYQAPLEAHLNFHQQHAEPIYRSMGVHPHQAGGSQQQKSKRSYMVDLNAMRSWSPPREIVRSPSEVTRLSQQMSRDHLLHEIRRGTSLRRVSSGRHHSAQPPAHSYSLEEGHLQHRGRQQAEYTYQRSHSQQPPSSRQPRATRFTDFQGRETAF